MQNTQRGTKEQKQELKLFRHLGEKEEKRRREDLQEPIHNDDESDIINGQSHSSQHNHHGYKPSLRHSGGSHRSCSGCDAAGQEEKNMCVYVPVYVCVHERKYV